jgi:hypothetical protein
MKVHLHNFSKIKSQKIVTKQQELRFFRGGPKAYGSGTLPSTIYKKNSTPL